MATNSSVLRQPRPSSLADVLDLILDKGLVIDAYIRVSLVGIELLTIDARIVIASVDTYLRFAEATNRLDLRASDSSRGLPQLVGSMMEGGASSKTRGALSGVADEVSGWFGGGDDQNEDGGEREPARAANRGREERAGGGAGGRRSRSDDDGRRSRAPRERRERETGDGESADDTDGES
jgi:hypothetical protein